ncbi:MAG: hypothetical protein ACOCQX_03445 [Candidatus Nanoarchaeia archaeon]
MNKILVSILAFLLFLPIAHAGLQVDLEKHTNRIFPHEQANFSLHVANTGDTDEKVSYFFPSTSGWSITTDPTASARTIEPGENVTTNIKVKPIEDRLIPKEYDLNFRVSSLTTGEKYPLAFRIYLRNAEAYRSYVPIINIDVDAQEEVIPTESAKLKITLNNRNRLNISNFSLKIQSSVNPENDQVLSLNVPPNGVVKEEIELNYPDNTTPTTDEILLKPTIAEYNKTYNTIEKIIKIAGYTDVKTEEKIDKGFLKKKESFIYTNNGNTEATKTKRLRSGTFKEFFTRGSPDYEEVNIDGYKYLEWNLDIEPQETKTINVTVNYRPLFIVLLLLAVGLALYYLERSPVIIKKETKRIPGFEGETSRLKVLLHVKNRTNKPIENLDVVDTIPKIAQLGKKHSVGTMQPSKVLNHEKKGTIVKWNIPVLEAYEERIVSYQIYSKLEIIGPMKLSKATVKYKNKRGKTSRVYSNNVLSS